MVCEAPLFSVFIMYIHNSLARVVCNIIKFRSNTVTLLKCLRWCPIPSVYNSRFSDHPKNAAKNRLISLSLLTSNAISLLQGVSQICCQSQTYDLKLSDDPSAMLLRKCGILGHQISDFVHI